MEKHSFGLEPITCHAWNKNRTQVAVSANSQEVDIYEKKGTSWNKKYTLGEHTQRVTSIDWAANSNRIVTCGSDRNAYVWSLNGNDEWKPSLVILRINRAATCVRWSPKENKFAVRSGARLVSICYFEDDNDWWVSKHIKKPIRSTVTTIDWHPNNMLLACGSTDFKVRVFSAYVKDIETKPSSNTWGTKMPFGVCLKEFGGGGGWVHSVSFDKIGDRLAWCGHDSTLTVVNGASDFALGHCVMKTLPCLTLQWMGPSTIIAAGHDCELMRFRVDDKTKITFEGKVSVAQKKSAGTVSAMAMFKNLDKRATADDDSKKASVHQNSINQLFIHTGEKEAIAKLSSVGMDGQMVIWNQSSLEASLGNMKI
eukprot:XP_790807.2 PREDICTED: actin-related protein 2/3 complex subunit 1A [Strongylocentrotus purpuratus]